MVNQRPLTAAEVILLARLHGSQRALGEAVGVVPATVNGWTQGATIPKTSQFALRAAGRRWRKLHYGAVVSLLDACEDSE